ncbi:MAG: hypothetical protein QOI03_1670 [Solirubrobacteraceae bacterium]|jgi:hypothetical protein|nr:hypothetical protein [Solirubrobacteraceae bacterium]
MPDLPDPAHTTDICLLLRAHAEQHWLLYEVVPVVRQLEQRASLPEDQLGAALAYLEAQWIEARRRSAVTDRAHAELERGDSGSLHDAADRYHAAVRRLRMVLARRVELLLAPSSEIAPREHASF